MLTRLANVIYGACSALAALLACFAVYATATEPGGSRWIVLGFFGIPAVLAFLLGRAVLYVLTGTTTPAPAKGATGSQPAAVPSPTNEAEDANAAEAQTTMYIKVRCEVGRVFARHLSDPNEDHATQFARYAGIRDECLMRLDTLEDEFYRGFATDQIVDLCMTAGEVPIAKALLIGVRDTFIRGQILESWPALQQPRAEDGQAAEEVTAR